MFPHGLVSNTGFSFTELYYQLQTSSQNITMKKTIYTAILLASITSANIVFSYIQPSCDYVTKPQNCLHGQVCVKNNTCVSAGAVAHRGNNIIRPDGKCGQAFDGATCDPNGPYGPCCSQHGWCGKTPEHGLVSNGCQPGCETDAAVSGISSVVASSEQPTSAAPLSEPKIGPPTATASAPTASGSVTTDGTCGAAHGNTICGDWPRGSCCSM